MRINPQPARRPSLSGRSPVQNVSYVPGPYPHVPHPLPPEKGPFGDQSFPVTHIGSMV
jgi:hypothetical protein